MFMSIAEACKGISWLKELIEFKATGIHWLSKFSFGL